MANIVVANAKIIVTGKRSTESRISSTDQEIHFDNTCALHFTVQVTQCFMLLQVIMYIVIKLKIRG